MTEGTGVLDQHSSTGNPADERIFLVVVDQSDEMELALHFACRCARRAGGRVALLYVVETEEFSHWMAVDDLISGEARAEGEKIVEEASAKALEQTGRIPVLYFREGNSRDELLKLLVAEDEQISILVLAASFASGGPGPLISALAGKFLGKFNVPITIVPGNITLEQIDAIT